MAAGWSSAPRGVRSVGHSGTRFTTVESEPPRPSPELLRTGKISAIGALAIIIICDNIKNVPFVIREYVAADGTNPFRRWLA